MFEALSYDFMQRAFLAGFIIATLASVSGVFVVLKRYSMMSETLAHASLLGVAIGLVAGFSPLWVAVIVAIVSAWSIEYLRANFSLYSDAVLSIVLSGSLALAIIIVSLGGAFNSSLFSYLFGSILSVSYDDLLTTLFFGFIVLVFLAYYARELYFIAFDEEVAQVNGIKVRFLNYLFVSIVAIIIALSIRVVGTLLIGALMVIPAMSALQFHVGFLLSIFIAFCIAIMSVFFGILLSYVFAIPSGATIVLVVILFFILSLVINKK